MKYKTGLAWEMIESDPELRLELDSIEKHPNRDDEMVNSLLEFYARIDRRMKTTVEIEPEACFIV